ncbi:MAG: 1-acyl-sn-glycerol-3-phosphate acyltransferase [Fidelibacterota bacterium]|nr:MAG: 1-acyl-sn-glycerol-3-phosphate acyltransferase [Candidatus Neomarinimicrobiota bacterium]
MKPVIITFYRSVLGYLTLLIGGIIFLIITFLPPERLRFRAATFYCRAVLISIGVRLHIIGTYPPDQAYIYMANHSSFIDQFVLGGIMKGKFTAIVAQKQAKYFFWGWVLKRFRAVFIRRRDLTSAIASIKEAEERLKQGFQVGFMPEGTRTLDGKLGRLKKGGFHLAINTGAPILPIGIEGAFRFKPKGRLTVRPGPVIVRIGEPLTAEHYRQMTMEEVMENVRQQLLVLSGEVPAA